MITARRFPGDQFQFSDECFISLVRFFSHGSDHLTFWRHGYKAFMITETAFYRYPYYHSAQDTPGKLNYEPYAEMANGLFLMLSRLAITEKRNFII